MKTTHRRFVQMAIYLLLCALSLPTFGYDQQYIANINEQYLKSFGLNLEISKPIELPFKKSLVDQIKYTFSSKPLSLPPLSEQEKRYSALRACHKNIYNTHSLIDLHLAHKIELAHGTETDSKDHLAFRISTVANAQNELTNLMNTECGKIILVHKISQPHTDTAQIIKGQHIINTCVTNDQLRTALTETLKIMGKNETSLLSYYSDKDLVHTWATELKHSYYWRLPILTKLNNSAQGLEISVILSSTLKLIDAPMQIGLVRFALKKAYKKMDIEYNKSVQLITNASTIYNTYKLVPSILNDLTDIKLMRDVNNLLRQHLMDVAQYINNAKKLYKLLCQCPEIRDNFSSLQELEALVKPSKEQSKEFNELIQLLNTDTFKGKTSLFTITGHVLRAHALMSMKSVQEQFTRIMSTIGELDTYVTLAHKIYATTDKEVRYSFVQFDTTSSTPYIKATGLWNPFVHESQAVTNDIEMGSTRPRNIVLSGPNTGGKSTLSKAVLINTILAQTFGVVAAKSMIITPFGNLDCHLNIGDSTASGLSGLQAEVKRAREIIAKLRNTQGFSFILLDEIFTATSPQQAENLAVSFISKLSEHPHCIFINAAHFDGIIQFAQLSKNCKNYHMGAILDTEGKVVTYTYKLIEGYSTVKNAEQVAEEIFVDW